MTKGPDYRAKCCGRLALSRASIDDDKPFPDPFASSCSLLLLTSKFHRLMPRPTVEKDTSFYSHLLSLVPHSTLFSIYIPFLSTTGVTIGVPYKGC